MIQFFNDTIIQLFNGLINITDFVKVKILTVLSINSVFIIHNS